MTSLFPFFHKEAPAYLLDGKTHVPRDAQLLFVLSEFSNLPFPLVAAGAVAAVVRRFGVLR